MSLFPRFVSHDFPRIVSSDFAPVWRLLDDYANQAVSAAARSSDQSHGGVARFQQSFNPRFDVKEGADAYELKGELPGVEQKNVEIEFPDAQTIVIKGSTGYSREEGQAPTAATSAAEQTPAPQADAEPTPSEHSHQATVEDEPEIIDAADATSNADSTEATPAATPASATPQAEVAKTNTTEEVAHPARYWVSERYTGSFQRTFNFPAPVDTDNAKARLRDGVLEVTIPKVQKVGIKRIAIE